MAAIVDFLEDSNEDITIQVSIPSWVQHIEAAFRDPQLKAKIAQVTHVYSPLSLVTFDLQIACLCVIKIQQRPLYLALKALNVQLTELYSKIHSKVSPKIVCNLAEFVETIATNIENSIVPYLGNSPIYRFFPLNLFENYNEVMSSIGFLAQQLLNIKITSKLFKYNLETYYVDFCTMKTKIDEWQAENGPVAFIFVVNALSRKRNKEEVEEYYSNVVCEILQCMKSVEHTILENTEAKNIIDVLEFIEKCYMNFREAFQRLDFYVLRYYINTIKYYIGVLENVCKIYNVDINLYFEETKKHIERNERLLKYVFSGRPYYLS
jgi:hypothetical protein